MEKKTKGFSLVELSIVLVITGILLSIAIKGKSLIDTAKFTSDLYKIRNISMGVNIYLNERKFPEVNYLTTNVAHLSYNDLVKGNYILLSDLFPKTLRYTSKLDYFNPQDMGKIPVTIVSCYFGSDSSQNFMVADARDGKDRSRSVCIALRNGTDASGGENISPYQACRYDNTLDDSNILTGNGLMALGTLNSFSVPFGQECYRNSKKPEASQGWVYMIYQK